MRLTVQTDYALRLLIFLAAARDTLATVNEVAAAYDISRDHVAKVCHRLAREGYVEAMRGRGGGLRLARPAAEIAIGEVVRRVEPDFALVPCLDPVDAACCIDCCCVLRHAMQAARDAFLAALDGYSLADLVRPRARLAAALGLQPPPRAGTAARRRGA
jgi:Rrf2 family nitric oxide-sensitive transcriptional repressor